MFERFVRSSKRAVVLAQEEARGMGHHHIAPHHLLLAVAEVHHPAAQALETAGVGADEIRHRILQLAPGSTNRPVGHLQFTLEARRTLQGALLQSVDRGHSWIGCEHLLLSLLIEAGHGFDVIARVHLPIQSVRSRLEPLLPAAEAQAAAENAADAAEAAAAAGAPAPTRWRFRRG